MLRLTPHGDVLRLEMASAASRAVGYSASAYLLRGVLVDTGIPAAAAGLRRFLDERAAAGTPVRGAVLTHAHEDHAGNVALLAERGVPLAMGTATDRAVRAVGPVGLYRRLTWHPMRPLAGPAPGFDPAPLVLVPTPGHSPDHHAVWDPETETLFGGDLFLGVKVRVAHHEEEPRRLVGSLRAAAALRPRRLFDAHRGPVDHPAEALAAKAAWHEETIGAVDTLIDRGWEDGAILRTVLGGESLTGWLSARDYSRLNFVRRLRATRTP
jgi:glyoxylase-like metal-dependent hydrolase (beta-lactamase superfamily II)